MKDPGYSDGLDPRRECRESTEWHLLWDEASLTPGAVPASVEMQTVQPVAATLRLKQPE